MTRTVSTSGWMLYPQTDGSQTTSQSPPQEVSQGSGMLQEYGGIAKNLISPGSTSIAEGYNKIYDFATGFEGAPGTNLATGTTSSGTFGGNNITNAAYSYAGGKLANELFDNKGYSDIGGSVGAGLGASAAVGGSAAAASLMGTVGWAAGPIGAIAGAVIGSAIGSLFGGGDEDYRFRTYSGELGEDSQLNIDQLAEKQSDWDSISSGQGEAFDRWKGGDYSSNTGSAYKWLKEGTTFNIGDKYNSTSTDYKAGINKDWASVETAFGKYTVGHIDDIPGRTNFANGWVDAIGKLDAAVASILTPEQIAASKDGLAGSIQGTPEWHNTSGQNFATDAMIIDRYTAIFELADRDDLAQQLTTAMDRSISGVAEDGGEVARAIPMLTQLLQEQSQTKASATAATIQRPATPVAAPKRGRVTITRPEGVVNPAMELNYA